MELEEIKYKMLQRKTIALNKDQRHAYELMALGKSIFITGAGGTGKTSCIKMFYNKEIIKDENLQVPHPLLQQRKFVLTPLNELLPNFKHPVLKKSIHHLLRICKDKL